MKTKQKGAASITIDLRGGIITVRHSTTKEILLDFEANDGAWDEIWNGIYKAKNL